MGLDTVEIVMRIEEELSIELPDLELGSVRTVGDLYQVVLSKTRTKGLTDNTVWERIVFILSDQMQIDPGKIVAKARISDDLRID